MLTTIHIAVRDRVPTITEGEDVISFNSDYVTEFDFDEEWQSNVKTVYFICEDGSYQAVVMSGNTCDVPMMAGEHRRIFVGVQEGTSEKPGVLKTTRPCCLKVADSIADYIGQPIPDPAPSVYEQIITMLENLTTPTWETVQNKPFSTLGDGLTVDEDGVLSAEGGGGSPNAVQYVAQELTDEQKAQARENIGAKAATEKSAYIISRTRSYGHISLYDMDFDGIYAQIRSGKVVMLLVNGATYYGGLSTAGSGKEIVFYNIVDISDSGGRDKGITYFGFTWRKGDNWLTEWWGDIPRVKVDSTLTNSGSAADAKAVGDELAKKQPKGDYLTTEIDPTVPPWAKSPTKPTYTAAEVGALPNTTVIPPAYTLPQATSTALGGVKASEKTNEMTQQVGVDEEGILWTTKTPNVAKWALADLPFTENEISDTLSGAGFVTNPTNFEDGKTYFRYHAGATNFTWTNPNPQVGAVKITVLSWKQWDKTATGNSSYLNIIYSDGSKALFSPKYGIVSTYTTNATKTLSQIKGNYDIENWILLDMDVMSIVADYDAPSGSSVTTDSELSLTSENPVQNKIVTSALAEKITAPSTASVGQIIKVKSVDNAGKPTEWEATDMPSGGGGKEWTKILEAEVTEATAIFEISDLDNYTELLVINGGLQNATSTDSAQNLYINGIQVCLEFVNVPKSGSLAYNHAIAKYNGLVWECRKPGRAISQTNITPSNAYIPYNVVLGVGKATTVKLETANSTYAPITGKITIYGR